MMNHGCCRSSLHARPREMRRRRRRRRCAHHVHIRSERSQVVVRQLVDDIARAQDVLYFAGLQQRFKLLGEVSLAMRDVQVADDEDEHLGTMKKENQHEEER